MIPVVGSASSHSSVIMGETEIVCNEKAALGLFRRATFYVVVDLKFRS
jgi:hypothetical protein